MKSCFVRYPWHKRYFFYSNVLKSAYMSDYIYVFNWFVVGATGYDDSPVADRR